MHENTPHFLFFSFFETFRGVCPSTPPPPHGAAYILIREMKVYLFWLTSNLHTSLHTDSMTTEIYKSGPSDTACDPQKNKNKNKTHFFITENLTGAPLQMTLS